MHPHIMGYPGICECIPIYWGTPVYGNASPYIGVPQHLGMHILRYPRSIFDQMELTPKKRPPPPLDGKSGEKAAKTLCVAECDWAKLDKHWLQTKVGEDGTLRMGCKICETAWTTSSKARRAASSRALSMWANCAIMPGSSSSNVLRHERSKVQFFNS